MNADTPNPAKPEAVSNQISAFSKHPRKNADVSGKGSKTSRSLTATLAIAFAALSGIVLVISSGFEMFFHFKAQRESISAKQQIIAGEAANRVAGFVGDKFNLLESGVRIGETATASGKTRKKVLEIILGREPAFRHVVLMDFKHNELAKATRQSHAEWEAFRGRIETNIFPRIRNGKRVIGAVTMDSVTSEPMLIIAVPSVNILGEISGALIAEVNLKFMWDLVDRLKVGKTGYAYVVDRTGRLIAFGDTGRVLSGENLSGLKNISSFINHPESPDGEGANIFTGILGNRVVSTYVSLKTPDWAVITELPVREAYGPMITSLLTSAVILLVMVSLAAMTGVVLAKRITKPVGDLTETAARIADGQLELKAAKSGTADIVRLADAFNHMTDQLNRMLAAGEDRNRKLKLEIDQRKKAETALDESRSVLKATLEAGRDGVLVVLKTGAVTHYNTRFREIWSIPEDILKTGDDGLLIEHVRNQLTEPDRFASKIKALYQDSGPSVDTIHFRDGRILDRLSYPLMMQGTETGRVWFFRDVTKERKAEAELRSLRNYLTNIIDSMPSVLVGVDAEGRVTQWNKQAESATGLSFEKAQEQPLNRVFSRLENQLDQIKTAILKREVIRQHKVASAQAEETHFEDVTIFPLVENGVEGAVIRIDDVTEKVRLEEMMIQSEKMLSVGGLAAGMAHEINNPLAGMMQTAEVMAGRLCGNLDIPANRKAAEAAGTSLSSIEAFMQTRGIPRMLATINESGQRVAAIVENMLSFARKNEATVSSHDVAALADKTIELASTDYDLKKQYDFKKIRIEREYAGVLPPIPCEGPKIQQVLLNIIRNAAEAMQEVGVENPRLSFRTRLDRIDRMAVLEIEDNGPGMNETVRKRVFEPFFTTKPAGVGTGLGLSVSFFIITENHGGEMAVESTPGKGTKFIIRLPMAANKDIPGKEIQ